MRAYKRFDKRGFTLVELMIVVAIIGVLAALAIYGVRSYLASAKTSEAKNNVGAITRGAVAAYERESTPPAILGDAALSTAAVHALCTNTGGTAGPTPAAVPEAKKYQPSTVAGADFNQGTGADGWSCLRFNISEPIYYSYTYDSKVLVGAAPGTDFQVRAMGDLDGNKTTSTFVRGATLRNATVVLATELYIVNEFE